MQYKLLTPGPLTTTDTVKREMMIDHCTWDDDYKSVTQKIRAGLLKLAHVSEEEYTSVLMQGSGTFGVEAAITTLVGEDDYLLIDPRQWRIWRAHGRYCASCGHFLSYAFLGN